MLIRRGVVTGLLITVAGCGTSHPPIERATFEPLSYPSPARGDVVDTYHGVPVADPYRALEDPDSPGARAWIEAQNAITFPWLESIPQRETFKRRLTELYNYERFGLPNEEGGRYFFSRNDGLQDQSVLYVADGLDGTPRVVLDPNTWSADGTISLAGTSVSDDGRYLAYATSDGGSDWRTWKVHDVDRGMDLADEVRWAKFSGASWTKDGSGFYYSRYDAPAEGEALQSVNKNQKLYFHARGTGQGSDTLVYERPDQPDWGLSGFVSHDGEYLLINVSWGTRQENNLFYRDLRTSGSPIVELLTGFTATWDFVGNDGATFYFVTTLDAPRGRLVAIDTLAPRPDSPLTIVPESSNTLTGVSYVGGRFICTYLKDARSDVRIYARDGRHERDVDLPGIGTAGGFGGDPDRTETFYTFTSFTYPSTIFRYDVATGQSEVFRQPDVDFDPASYETRQVFYRSKDGTRVPMFLTYRKGMKRDGSNPTLLYGYGGFNISILPSFSPSRIVWLDLGGIYAVPNIRGGGEYGKAWHEAGIKASKQNVFDDFIAAAEWLIDNRYTSTPRLAINGGSNGGLLVGACMIQRPDLFGAAIPAVGVLDMLRFDKFTIGWAWRSDYGYPDENADEFRANLAYSPYHNVKPGECYPPTLITTADHDDRVVPAHSFKFAAALQNAQGCANPILIRIETRAGHGAGTPISKTIEQVADQYAFLVRALGVLAE